MSRIHIYILALIAACTAITPAAAAPAATITERADSAYAADDYLLAAELYTAAADSLGTSAILHYNLGNTWFRLGRPGKAVLEYERALRLDPANEDIRANLAFVSSRLIDRPGPRGTLFSNMADNAALAIASDAWAWCAFASFIFLLGALALYFFGPSVFLRKMGFFGGMVLMAATALCIIFAARAGALASATDKAVITVPSTILSTSPREPRNRTEEAILLHEGTRLTVLDSVTSTIDSIPATWLDVRIDNDHRAWINRQAVEFIKN